MKGKQTLYDFLYNNLHELIVSGRLPYGSKFPSISELCDVYNIGIRTVKEVLKALKAEGYIETHERKATIVSYNLYKADNINAMTRYLLEHRIEIIEIYQTMAIIMPSIFFFAIQMQSDQQLQKWSILLEQTENRSAVQCEKICTQIFYQLLDESCNPLFRSIFSALEIYARPVYFVNYEVYQKYFKIADNFKGIAQATSSLMTRNKNEIEARFGAMYEAIINIIEKTLLVLTHQYPHIQKTAVSFSWSAELGRDHLYTQITRDLIDKIALGFYPQSTFLPSEAQLAKNYGVSVATIRKSLKMLNELGFGKTMNVKGTKVMIQPDEYAIKCIHNKHYQQDTLLYLNAMQVMAILIKKAAPLAFPNIKQAQIKKLEKEMLDPHKIILECLLDCIIDNLELLPLKTIIKETNKVIHWGYYFSFYPSEKKSINIINIKSKQAFAYLCAGNVEMFTAKLSSSFNHSLLVIRDYLIEYGLTEAKKIIVPEEI